MRNFKNLLCWTTLLWAAVAGCDYGMTPEEQEEGTFDESGLEEELAIAESGLAATTETSFKLPAPSSVTVKSKANLHAIAPALTSLVEMNSTPTNPAPLCDCDVLCAACTDAMICGHESLALQNCESCAKCMQACDSQKKSK